MGRARLAAVAAAGALFVGAIGGAPSPLYEDPEGDVSLPGFDVVSVDAGVLPAASPFAIEGVDAGTQVWGLLEFADGRLLLIVTAIPHAPDRIQIAGAVSAFIIVPGEPEQDAVPDGLDDERDVDMTPRHPPVAPPPEAAPFTSHPNPHGVDELDAEGNPTGVDLGMDHPARIQGVELRHNPDGSIDVVVSRGRVDDPARTSVDVFGYDAGGNALVFAEWRAAGPIFDSRAFDQRTGEAPPPGSVGVDFLPGGARVRFTIPADLADGVATIQAQSRVQMEEGGSIARSFTERLEVPELGSVSSLRARSLTALAFGVDPRVLGHSRSLSFRYPDPQGPDLTLHVGAGTVAGTGRGTSLTRAFESEDSERSYTPSERDGHAARTFDDVEPSPPDDGIVDTTTTSSLPEETTTTEAPDVASPPPDTPEEEPGDGGFPIGPVLLLLIALLAVLAGFVWWRSRKGPCDDEKAAWEAARRRCETAREELEAARRYLDEKRAAGDGLREELGALERARESSIEESGKTYHQIPGGRVTPEGLEEVITAKRDQVVSAEGAVRTAEESVREWGRQVEEHCAEEEAARSRYEECVGEAEAPPPAAEEPPPEEPAPPATAPGEQQAPPPATPAEERPPVPDETAESREPTVPGGCREGDERWEEFDGPHPFDALDPDGRVKLGVSYAIGTRRGIPLGTVDQFLPTAKNRTMSYGDFMSLADHQIEGAFGPLRETFSKATDVAREPPSLTVAITVTLVQVQAYCDRLLRCVRGEWRDTRQRRCRQERTAKPRQVTAQANISGSSKDVVADVKKVFDRAKATIEAGRAVDAYCTDCVEGRRG
jgi:hypothetical protein